MKIATIFILLFTLVNSTTRAATVKSSQKPIVRLKLKPQPKVPTRAIKKIAQPAKKRPVRKTQPTKIRAKTKFIPPPINTTELIYRITRWSTFSVNKNPAIAVGKNLFLTSLSRLDILHTQLFTVESGNNQKEARVVALDVNQNLALLQSDMTAPYPMLFSSLPLSNSSNDLTRIATISSNLTIQLSESSANALPLLNPSQLAIVFNQQTNPVGILLSSSSQLIPNQTILKLIGQSQKINPTEEFKRQIVLAVHDLASDFQFLNSMKCMNDNSDVNCLGGKEIGLGAQKKVGNIIYGYTHQESNKKIDLRSDKAEIIINQLNEPFRSQFESLASKQTSLCKQRYVATTKKQLYLVNTCISPHLQISGSYVAGFQFISVFKEELKLSFLIFNGFAVPDIQKMVKSVLTRVGGPHAR